MLHLNRIKYSTVIDSLLVLLNIMNGGLSIIPMLLLFDSVPYNLVLVTLLNIFWCVINAKHIRLIFFSKALIPYFAVLFYQIFLGRFEFSITMLFLNLSFLIVLIGMMGKYKENTSNVLMNSFVFYSCINVIGVCLAFFLILGGYLEPFSNSIDVSILAKDDEIAYFPGYLSVLRPNDSIRVAFLPSFGLFCGYSHEPHIVGYICLPAFFYLMYKLGENKLVLKIVVVIIYALFFLITLSATSFISVSIVTFAGLFMRGRQPGHKRSWVLMGVLVIGAILAATIIQDSFSFVFDKLTATGGSKDYSEARIEYAFSPNTFFGTTIYSTSIDGDIGFITAILNLSFYVSAAFLCLKMLRNNNRAVFYCGLALLYFLCHSMKAFLMIYRFPFTLFIIMLSYMVLLSNNRNKVLKRHNEKRIKE